MDEYDFISFKIAVLESDLDNILDSSRWPRGVIVRKFKRHVARAAKNL